MLALSAGQLSDELTENLGCLNRKFFHAVLQLVAGKAPEPMLGLESFQYFEKFLVGIRQGSGMVLGDSGSLLKSRSPLDLLTFLREVEEAKSLEDLAYVVDIVIIGKLPSSENQVPGGPLQLPGVDEVDGCQVGRPSSPAETVHFFWNAEEPLEDLARDGVLIAEQRMSSEETEDPEPARIPTTAGGESTQSATCEEGGAWRRINSIGEIGLVFGHAGSVDFFSEVPSFAPTEALDVFEELVVVLASSKQAEPGSRLGFPQDPCHHQTVCIGSQIAGKNALVDRGPAVSSPELLAFLSPLVGVEETSEWIAK
jgi:hypothetical protein